MVSPLTSKNFKNNFLINFRGSLKSCPPLTSQNVNNIEIIHSFQGPRSLNLIPMLFPLTGRKTTRKKEKCAGQRRPESNDFDRSIPDLGTTPSLGLSGGGGGGGPLGLSTGRTRTCGVMQDYDPYAPCGDSRANDVSMRPVS